jgi:hypothetical protein
MLKTLLRAATQRHSVQSNVVPSPRKNEALPEYARDKIEAMSRLNQNGILIDDNEDNIKKAFRSNCGYNLVRKYFR